MISSFLDFSKKIDFHVDSWINEFQFFQFFGVNLDILHVHVKKHVLATPEIKIGKFLRKKLFSLRAVIHSL